MHGLAKDSKTSLPASGIGRPKISKACGAVLNDAARKLFPSALEKFAWLLKYGQNLIPIKIYNVGKGGVFYNIFDGFLTVYGME